MLVSLQWIPTFFYSVRQINEQLEMQALSLMLIVDTGYITIA